MDSNERTLASLACVIASQSFDNSRLRDHIDSVISERTTLDKRVRELEAAAKCPVPADPVPPDRILPPCLRWTKERPSGCWALRLTNARNGILTFYDASDTSSPETTHGWLSFAEDAR